MCRYAYMCWNKYFFNFDSALRLFCMSLYNNGTILCRSNEMFYDVSFCYGYYLSSNREYYFRHCSKFSATECISQSYFLLRCIIFIDIGIDFIFCILHIIEYIHNIRNQTTGTYLNLNMLKCHLIKFNKSRTSISFLLTLCTVSVFLLNTYLLYLALLPVSNSCTANGALKIQDFILRIMRKFFLFNPCYYLSLQSVLYFRLVGRQLASIICPPYSYY